MTGMRMAQTRGGKKSWRGWPGSTKGWVGGGWVSFVEKGVYGWRIVGCRGGGKGIWYHEEGPCRVVEKDCGGYDEHC